MKKNTLKDTLKEIDAISKLLKESYVFDEEEMTLDDMYMDGEEGSEEMMDEPSVSSSDERINQIRAIALEGIQEFAEDVESEQYQFFKKVWLMCDKVYESGENTEK